MTDYKEQLEYFFKMKKPIRNSMDEEIQRILYFMREMSTICTRNNQPELLKEISASFNNYVERYSSFK